MSKPKVGLKNTPPIVHYYRRQSGLKIWNQYHYVVKVPSPTLLVPSLMMPLLPPLPFAATPILIRLLAAATATATTTFFFLFFLSAFRLLLR
jgi:hypothetical protein